MTIDHAAPVECRYDVFISYSRKDREFARRLEQELRRYHPPRDLEVPQRYLRVFRDEEDFSGAEYHDSLDRTLADAAKLVVICSPNAAASERVAEEIVRFSDFRSEQHIVPVLLDGVPNNEAARDEELPRRAFPDALVDRLPIPLAADYRGFTPGIDKIRKGKFAPAWFKVIADVYAGYGVDRAGLERRERRREIRRLRNLVIVSSAIAVALIGLTTWALISRSQAIAQQLIANRERLRADENAREAMTQRDSARLQTQVAISRQLASNSAYLLTRDVELSLLVALEAVDTYDTLEARKALFAAVTRVASVEKLLRFKAGQVVHASFGPGQRLIALVRETQPGTHSSSLRRWDLSATKPIGTSAAETSSGPERNLEAGKPVAVSADGRYMATGKCQVISEGAEGRDGQYRAYCMEGSVDIFAITSSGLVKEKSIAHRGWPEAMAFNASGSIVALRSCERANATLGDVCEESAIALLDVQSAQSSSIDRRFAPARFAVSPRGLVAAASNNSIQLLTKSGGLFRELLKPYAQSISALSFGHSEQLIAAGTTDGRIFLIDLTNLRDVEHLLTGHASAVSSLSFSSDGERLVSASADGTILVHRASMNRLARVLGRHGRPVSTVAFSPDGRLVISGASDQRINFWDVSPAAGLKQPVAVISDGIQQFVECVAFSPDGTVIAANTRSVYVGSNVLQLLNATTRKPIGGGIRVSGQGCNAFRPRRDQIAASRSDAVSLFDVKTTRSIGLSLPCCAGGIDGQLFSADGETLISAADYGKVVTWDLGGEHPRSTVLMDRERSVTGVALNAKGTRLALAGEGWAEIVDLTKPRSTAIEAGIPGRAIGAAFHPTDEFLIVGTDESGIHLLDSRLGEVLEPLQSKGRSLRSVALSPDGRTIAAGYSDGAVMVWSLGLEEWRSIACRVVSRGMSPTEWRRYIGDAPPRDACAPKR